MSSDLPTSLMREGFGVLAAVGGPFVIALFAVGLLVGILQAATQINDSAVGFLPRLVTGVLVAYFAGPWVMERLAHYLVAAFQGMSGSM
jgi:flagellar biosynthesis protein FliQ